MELMMFSAEWCTLCQTIEQYWRKVADHFDLAYTEYDVDKDYEMFLKFNVKSVPTFILVKDGEIISNKTGAFTEQQLMDWFFEDVNGKKETV